VGKPENSEGYLVIEVGEWGRHYGTVYVPWEMWKSLRPVAQEFVFYIENHGRFRIEFDVPIRRLKL
jgi:hypothetical protein